MPDQFWSLTPSEFRIKHAAFTRSEGRRRSLVLEHALMVGHYKDKDKNALRHAVNSLRRYPVRDTDDGADPYTD